MIPGYVSGRKYACKTPPRKIKFTLVFSQNNVVGAMKRVRKPKPGNGGIVNVVKEDCSSNSHLAADVSIAEYRFGP